LRGFEYHQGETLRFDADKHRSDLHREEIKGGQTLRNDAMKDENDKTTKEMLTDIVSAITGDKTMQAIQTTTTTIKKTASKKPAAAIKELQVISEVKLVPLDLIDTLPQLRTEFDQESIEELAKDILERGLLQPILLNPVDDRYQLIAGERRLRA
jgi:ParB family chromosome partitioning protein